MYILEPFVHRTIWGGNKLNRYLKKREEKAGHLYMVNGHEEMSNKIINGKYAGRTLKEVFELEKGSWKMSEFEEFPLTIALVDAAENLSIQVHPDNLYAQKAEGVNKGKTESWIFLDVPLSGWIYNGCKCDTKEQVINAVAEGRMEEITDRIRIGKDDYVCIEPGTLHAMTGGSLVYEIEYGSDFTYRFFDYNRVGQNGKPRGLHIEKALDVIKPEIRSRVCHDIRDKWISEESYEIRDMTSVCSYKNVGYDLECLSLIEGCGKAEGFNIHGGMSLILLPGEEINGLDAGRVIVSRVKRDYESEEQ